MGKLRSTINNTPEEHKMMYYRSLELQIEKAEHDWKIVQAWKIVWPEMFVVPNFRCINVVKHKEK
jgi:hypothetical protein